MDLFDHVIIYYEVHDLNMYQPRLLKKFQVIYYIFKDV